MRLSWRPRRSKPDPPEHLTDAYAAVAESVRELKEAEHQREEVHKVLSDVRSASDPFADLFRATLRPRNGDT